MCVGLSIFQGVFHGPGGALVTEFTFSNSIFGGLVTRVRCQERGGKGGRGGWKYYPTCHVRFLDTTDF